MQIINSAFGKPIPGSKFRVLDTDNPDDIDSIEFVTGMTIETLRRDSWRLPGATPEMVAALMRGDGANTATDGETANG